jgi:serine protease Do
MQQPKFRLSLALALVIALVFGFIAGVIGELWINQFLAPQIQFKDYRDLSKRLDELTAQQTKDLKDLLSEQDFSINKVVEQIQPAVATFYPDRKSSDLLDSIYLDEQVLGSGFILTNDGWLITSSQVLADPEAEYNVLVDQEIYSVTKFIADDTTDAVFVKIEANNLPVVDLGAKNQLHYSQSVLVATSLEGVVRTTIDDLYYAQLESADDLIHSSESYYRFMLLNKSFLSQSLGSPVFDLEGKVVGFLMTQDGLVLPVDYFSQVIKSAVQKDQVQRTLLGVHYLDLELAPNYQNVQTKGALLMSQAKKSAVITNSPADKAGLKSGDIVLKVEREEVNRFHSLSELIQDYKPGDSVKLQILRDGQEQEVSVTLE